MELPSASSKMHRIAALLLTLLGGAAHAAAPSYMELVGELYAQLEFPRIAGDYCIATQPGMASDIAAQYRAWQSRQAKLLKEAADQYARANARLQPQGASLQQTEALLRQQLQAEDSSKFCRQYGFMVNERRKRSQSETVPLLEAVKNADADLTKQATGK